MAGGTLKKLILNGLQREISADNDQNFTRGGYYVTETQDTNGKPFPIFDKVSGKLAGVEERVSHADGTLETLDNAMQQCAQGNPVDAMFIPADRAKYTASGGAWIVVSGAADGMMTLREGKVTYDVVPVNGEWIPA